jgi:hypothetical protein
MRKLIERGLVVERKMDLATLPGAIPVTITEYEVPLPVHAAWCAWCSDGSRFGRLRRNHHGH